MFSWLQIEVPPRFPLRGFDVDPHLSPSTAQQWVSMCIRPIYIDIDHLEVFSMDRTGIINAPEGFLCNFNEGPSPAMYRHILDSH